MMPAYVIARVAISDRDQYMKYTAVAPSIILRYGGRVIARSEDAVALEGPEERRRIVIIEFPSAERAREWYGSPEYREARELRKEAAVGELVVIDSVDQGRNTGTPE
jgi:uncharacterized protein (DUF1330 family)